MRKIVDLSRPDNRNIYVWTDFKDTISKNIENNPKLGSKLYFMKNCKISRTQLRDSFKRTIKKENCDYIVIPSIDRIHNRVQYYGRKIFRYNNIIYLLSINYVNGKLTLGKESIDFFNSNNLPIPDISELSIFYVCEYQIMTDILDLMDIGKKFVYEDVLSKIVSSVGDTPTEKDIDDLISMFESNDPETNKLAITMINGWNIPEIEFTIKTILHKYHHKVRAIKSTCDIENVLKLTSGQESSLHYLFRVDSLITNDYDRYLCKRILLKDLKDKFTKDLSYYNNFGNFSITIHEEDNSNIGT